MLVALAGVGALSGLMLVWRPSILPAIPPLVLVVPVVAGVVVGGIPAGVVAVAAGFLAYDVLFIPPYGTLAVSAAQDWVALGVYAAVMLLVARVVAFLQAAQSEARRREEDTRRVYVLSELLIGDKPLAELLQLTADTIERAFGASSVAVLLPGSDDLLAVSATAGRPLGTAELARLQPSTGRADSLRAEGADGWLRVVLTAGGRPIGLVALAGRTLNRHEEALLRIYTNHAALAIERRQLREQAVRSELLEQVDHWRDALMGSVSHDLRTPLASITTAVSALRRGGPALVEADRAELLELIEVQAGNLSRLMTNLLDMTRIHAGGIELHREAVPLVELVDEAWEALAGTGQAVALSTDLPDDLPPVDVDQVLMVQALVNLFENAARYSPPGSPVEVRATPRDGVVELSVRDHGPGVPASERHRIFEMFNSTGGGRAGLGLTIARSFVEIHGQQIAVGDAEGGGACFVLTLPRADMATGEEGGAGRSVDGARWPA